MTDPAAKFRRKAIEALSRDTLASVTTKLELPVTDRRAHSAHIRAIMNAKAVPFEDVLRLLSRDELKSICASLNLDSSGKEKDPIIQRICDAVSGAAAAPATPEAKPAHARAEKRAKPAAPSGGGDLGFEDKLF